MLGISKQATNIVIVGLVLGILYGSGRESSAHVEAACRGYLTGTREQLMQTAVFFSRIVLYSKGFDFYWRAYFDNAGQIFWRR